MVLVVDDEEGVRKLARRILEGAAYTVVEAENGVDALKIMEGKTSIDFLIADLDMPVMRGEEMTARIRAMRPDLNVLYVTAHIDSLMDERNLWEGEAFLEKPFTAAGLLEAVSLLKTGRIGDVPAAEPFSLRRLWRRLSPRRT